VLKKKRAKVLVGEMASKGISGRGWNLQKKKQEGHFLE